MESNLQGVIKIKDDFVSFYDVDLSIYKKWVEESCVKLLLLIFILLITGCASASPKQGEFREWQEEVKLNDGRVIVVTQKKKCSSGYTGKEQVACIARETWLTMNLPDFSDQPITWHEHLRARVINVDQGNLYIIGVFPTQREYYLYQQPEPPFVAYRWENNAWIRIPFEQVPESIYDVNMLYEGIPPPGIKYLSLEKKASKEVNGKPTYRPWVKRIDPKRKSNFNRIKSL